MPLTNYAGGRLFADRYGSGDPRVVALHGWGRDRRDFAKVLDGLDAVSVDLPGFGASPPPAEVVGAAGYADVVAELVRELAVRPVVVGHSFGGRVGTVLAASRPELVAGLVLAGVPLLRRADQPVRKPPLAYRLVRWGHRMGLISDEILEREKRKRGSADYKAASGVMRDILVKVVNETYERELARVTCPVRMVWGVDDQEVPPEVAHRSARLLAEVEVDVVGHCGHDVPREAPDRIRSAIEGLL